MTEREERLAFLRSVRLQAAATLAAIDNELVRVAGGGPAAAAALEGCPRCQKTTHQDEAGDVMVCGHCNCNYRGTEVVA